MCVLASRWGADKIKGYGKLAMKCAEHGLPRAKEGLEALMFDFSYTLPELAWMKGPAIKAQSFGMCHCELTLMSCLGGQDC